MIITDATINGSTLFITTKSGNGLVSKYAIPWSTAQNEGIPGVLNAIQSVGSQFDQTSVPQWVQQLIGQYVPGTN
ncbi:hypothetical protein ACOJUR_12190 [Alicyclobacillus tolerans]|uniref:hypothetical protein n=1 Tax=Alicyclobacillus tolerans TaxID=90970 RepID=UPI003B7A9B05